MLYAPGCSSDVVSSHLHPTTTTLPQRGETALILAARGGHADVCAALLDKGATVDFRDKVI